MLYLVFVGLAVAYLSEVNRIRDEVCAVPLTRSIGLEIIAGYQVASCNWGDVGFGGWSLLENATCPLLSNVSSAVGCAVGECGGNNVTLCYVDKSGLCSKCTISTVAPTTMSTTTVITSTTTLQPTATPINRCMAAKLSCARQCGLSPSDIFPFMDSCTTGFSGEILSCRSPPNCLCMIDPLDSGVSHPLYCQLSTCPAYFGIQGSLGWCRACGYNCGENQAGCIRDGFCGSVSRCSALDMCSGWRSAYCADGNCADAVGTDAPLTETVTAADSSPVAFAYIFTGVTVVALICCCVGWMLFYTRVKGWRQAVTTAQTKPSPAGAAPVIYRTDDIEVVDDVVRERREFVTAERLFA